MMRAGRILTATLILALALTGCADDDKDCVTCPEPQNPPDYHLLYSYVGTTIETKYVLTYSSRTGEIIDSAEYRGHPFNNMAFSHDGQYAVYTSNYDLELGTSETWVTETATGDTVSYLYGFGGLAAYISPDDRYLLLTGGPMHAILTFPGLSIVYEDSTQAWAGGFHPSRRSVIISYERALDSLFMIDFASSTVQVSSFPIVDTGGIGLLSLGVLYVERNCILVNSFVPDVAYYLQFYDIDSLALIHEVLTPHQITYRGVDLAPDGNRLFLAYNGGFDRPWVSGVDIYYFNTGELLPYITPDEIACCYERIAPTDIQILPDGESFFILDGGTGFWFGPVLQIDMNSKEVIRVILADSGNSSLIRLNPKDWANE